MTQEEIALKVGLDASKFAEGLRLMKGELSSASQHAEHSFLHAQSSARGFHKVIEQLNDSIPGLGTAFTAIANPISATFAGAAIAVGVVRSKLEQFNKELDKQGERAGKPMWTLEMMDALNKKIEDAHRAWKTFLRSLRPSETEAMVEAISEEKNPLLQHRQAFMAKERLAAQRDKSILATGTLVNQRSALEKILTTSPEMIKSAEDDVALAKATRIFHREMRSGFGFMGTERRAVEIEDPEEQERRVIEAQRKVDSIKARERKARLDLEANQKESAENERDIKEKASAIERLTKIQESTEWPEWEDMDTVRHIGSARISKKVNGKVVFDEDFLSNMASSQFVRPQDRIANLRMSKKVNGQTVYDTGEFTPSKSYLDLLDEVKKLTSTVQSGALVTQPRNGE
jgi:hypothetical protein